MLFSRQVDQARDAVERCRIEGARFKDAQDVGKTMTNMASLLEAVILCNRDKLQKNLCLKTRSSIKLSTVNNCTYGDFFVVGRLSMSYRHLSPFCARRHDFSICCANIWDKLDNNDSNHEWQPQGNIPENTIKSTDTEISSLQNAPLRRSKPMCIPSLRNPVLQTTIYCP